MRCEENESLKSYFARFTAKLIACETISDEKVRDALWNGLLMETLTGKILITKT